MEIILGGIAVIALLIVALAMPGVIRKHRVWKMHQRFQAAVMRFTITTQAFQAEVEKAAEALKNLASSMPIYFDARDEMRDRFSGLREEKEDKA